MKVLILFDLDERPPARQSIETYRHDLRDENWESEAAVVRALRELGHELALFGLHDDVAALLAELDRFKPDVVFNLCEAFAGKRDLEPQVVALLELQGIKVTGASSLGLKLCKDKALAKQLVAVAGVDVPRAVVVPVGRPKLAEPWRVFPALVKPLGLESSQGISNGSIVWDEGQRAARTRFVHERLGQSALVEEYIDGREFYVSLVVMADGSLQTFPARELFFGPRKPGEPRVATYRAKWDDAYRRRRGIRSGPARGLDSALRARLDATARNVAGALRLTGEGQRGAYARLDLRMTDDGRIFFLEANPNPSIARGDDFAASASDAGVRYVELIGTLLTIAEGGKKARPRQGRGLKRQAGAADCSRPGL